MYDILDLNNKKVGELKDIAEKLNLTKFDKLKKQELVYKILDEQAINPPKEEKKETVKAEKNQHITDLLRKSLKTKETSLSLRKKLKKQRRKFTCKRRSCY